MQRRAGPEKHFLCVAALRDFLVSLRDASQIGKYRITALLWEKRRTIIFDTSFFFIIWRTEEDNYALPSPLGCRRFI